MNFFTNSDSNANKPLDSKIPRKFITKASKANLIPRNRYLILSKQKLDRNEISGLIMEVNSLSFRVLDKEEKVIKPMKSINQIIDNPELINNIK